MAQSTTHTIGASFAAMASLSGPVQKLAGIISLKIRTAVTETSAEAHVGTMLSRKRGMHSLKTQFINSKVTRSRWCGFWVTKARSFRAAAFSSSLPVRQIIRSSTGSADTVAMVKPDASADPMRHSKNTERLIQSRGSSNEANSLPWSPTISNRWMKQLRLVVTALKKCCQQLGVTVEHHIKK